jgi:hypothetical protein
LLCKYQSHINVEWIEGDACIKYVLKYVMKGADLAFIQVIPEGEDGTGEIRVDYDETREMSLARYQTANEGMLTIYGNKIVRLSHQVIDSYLAIYYKILIYSAMSTMSIFLKNIMWFSVKAKKIWWQKKKKNAFKKAKSSEHH